MNVQRKVQAVYLYQTFIVDLLINMHELQLRKLVQFNDLAKIWHFCTPNINISVFPTLDPKNF